ncbi:hypothetical protein D3P07_25205 [Paenibacillus sp. 1011MAR3C5]|nr:hypothetical protein D3P07_25205 [Paenibacillus sp. 1011MAR3C5]
MHRLKQERELVKPIYFILNENREVFDNHWNSRSEAYEKLTEEEIRDVLEYTKQKLIELSNYLDTIKTEKRIKNFYKEYVDHLIKYHKSSFNMSYHMQYMFFYSELLLGSERYLIIMKKINNN